MISRHAVIIIEKLGWGFYLAFLVSDYSFEKFGEVFPVDVSHFQEVLRIDIIIDAKPLSLVEFDFIIIEPVEVLRIELIGEIVVV